MKRVFMLIMVFAVFASITGCGKKGPPKPPEEARNYYGVSR